LAGDVADPDLKLSMGFVLANERSRLRERPRPITVSLVEVLAQRRGRAWALALEAASEVLELAFGRPRVPGSCRPAASPA